jgi:hypothetical protein
MKVGNLVVVWLGGNLPFVRRKDSDDGEYHFVGGCYVRGIMDGEAINGKAAKGFQDFIFVCELSFLRFSLENMKLTQVNTPVTLLTTFLRFWVEKLQASHGIFSCED